jgi:hypothetical protein
MLFRKAKGRTLRDGAPVLDPVGGGKRNPG